MPWPILDAGKDGERAIVVCAKISLTCVGLRWCITYMSSLGCLRSLRQKRPDYLTDALGLRWIPLLGTLLSGIFLTIMSGQPDVIYHMTHPKEGNFVSFVLDALLFAFLVVTLGATLSATVQNYWQRERHAPRWLTAVLSGVAGMVIGAILIAAIAQPAATTNACSTTTGGEPVVHMGPGNFLQSSVTVPKGSKLLLVDDGSFLHILANGSWQNAHPKPPKEPGAPSVNNMQINGTSVEIGPFTTAGTYHIYCIVHQGMNLTVIVH